MCDWIFEFRLIDLKLLSVERITRSWWRLPNYTNSSIPRPKQYSHFEFGSTKEIEMTASKTNDIIFWMQDWFRKNVIVEVWSICLEYCTIQSRHLLKYSRWGYYKQQYLHTEQLMSISRFCKWFGYFSDNFTGWLNMLIIILIQLKSWVEWKLLIAIKVTFLQGDQDRC